MTKNNYFISTAIDYPSAPPHLGHLYEKVLADTIARWNRLNNVKVHFSTGVDEHGLKIQRMANKEDISPMEYVNKMSKLFSDLCEKYNISNDDFIRTTETRHEEVVKKIFDKLYKNDFIYKDSYTGLYCVECETFYTEKDLFYGKCPIHKITLETFTEEGYFFRMSHFQDNLIKHIKKNPKFIISNQKRNEILNRLKEPLKDLSITRKEVWGIRFPIDHDYNIAVWAEALINYLTTIDYPNKKYKEFWPGVHLIGPDIIWHHTVIWGSMLMAVGLELPSILTHGWINMKGEKMSKSIGNVVDPIDLANKYGVDELRYFLLREIPFGQDGDFSEDALKARINNELADSLGNLVSRIITIAEKKLDGRVKKGKVDEELSKKLDLKAIEKYIENFELHNALAEIFKFINECNKHVNDERPWEMQGEELNRHVYTLIEAIRIISILTSSFMPGTSSKINKQLGIKDGKIKDCKFGVVKEYKVKKEGILFRKVEQNGTN